MAGLAVIGDFGCLMHLVSDAVADIFSDDAEAVCLHIRLHSGGDIRQAIALAGILYALKEALLRHPDQPQRLVGHLTTGIGAGAVAVETADERPHVHADDVALLQHPFAGDAVDDIVSVDVGAFIGGFHGRCV